MLSCQNQQLTHRVHAWGFWGFLWNIQLIYGDAKCCMSHMWPNGDFVFLSKFTNTLTFGQYKVDQWHQSQPNAAHRKVKIWRVTIWVASNATQSGRKTTLVKALELLVFVCSVEYPYNSPQTDRLNEETRWSFFSHGPSPVLFLLESGWGNWTHTEAVETYLTTVLQKASEKVECWLFKGCLKEKEIKILTVMEIILLNHLTSLLNTTSVLSKLKDQQQHRHGTWKAHISTYFWLCRLTAATCECRCVNVCTASTDHQCTTMPGA